MQCYTQSIKKRIFGGLDMDRRITSVMEMMDVFTGERSVVFEREGRIEAPNWTQEDALIYNAGGRIRRFDLRDGSDTVIDTGFANHCNNDHVLSPNGKFLAVSHSPEEDWKSRIYILPAGGGEPVLVTEKGPSYLHGWSPDGRRLAYCAERNGNYDVYTIPVSGGVETRLTDAPGLDDGPEYALDGSIWFNSVRTGLMQVYRMDADGQHIRRR